MINETAHERFHALIRNERTPGSWLSSGTTLTGGEKTLVLSLSAGDNVFEATIQDSVGNQVVYSAATNNAFHLARVTGAPAAPVIASPFTGANFATTRTIAVTGTAAQTLDPATRPAQVRVQAASTATVPVDAAGNWMALVKLSVGSNRIRATALNIAGSASPETSIVVSVSATERVEPSSGDLQVVAAGQAATAPLVARVTDLAGTPLPGVAVSFSIATEPASADGYIGSVGQKTASTTTDATGLASVTLTVATSETNAAGFLQTTVVAATVPSQSGPAATFRTQGLGAFRFVAGNTNPPAQLVPLNDDCTPTAAAPLGDCPLGEVGSSVGGFAALVLDQYGSVVAGPGLGCQSSSSPGCVTFTVSGVGDLNGNSTIRVSSDASGVARSGRFTLGNSIFDPNSSFVMLHPDDLAATKIGTRQVTAQADGASGAVPFAAAAYPGKAENLQNQTPSSGSFATVQTSTEDPFVVIVTDRFGNAVANAQVTFTADTSAADYDPTDPPKFFRTETAATDAPPCAFKLAHQADTCAVDAVTATTFSQGQAFVQMIVGKHAGLDYNALATAGGSTATMTRITAPISNLSTPSAANYALQAQATAAATFAIDDTENDDTDPITAVVWKVQCDDVSPADGVCDATGTFHSARHAGDAVSFLADSAAFFSPQTAVTGGQASIDGGGRQAVRSPEVAALLHGPPSGNVSHLLNLSVSATLQTGAVSVAATGSHDLAQMNIEIPSVALSCSQTPRFNARSLCFPATSPEALTCRRDDEGVKTFVDATNGYTEDNALILRAIHPGTSPIAGRPIKKFNLSVKIDVAVPLNSPDYYDLVSGADGRPGFYDVSSDFRSTRLADSSVLIPFSESHDGCREIVAKSFKRNLSPLTTTLPANAHLSFSLASGSVIAEIPMPGAATGGGGWDDEITRSRSGPAQGTKSPNGVADWVEMRAWDFYLNPPPGGVFEPDDENQDANTVEIISGEPADVFSKVAKVTSIFETSASPTFNARTRGGTCPDRENSICRGVDSGTWIATPEVIFNLRKPELRTNSPSEKVYGELAQTYPSHFSTTRAFSNTAAHEARHAWQLSLLVRSSAGVDAAHSLPPGIVLTNDELSGNLRPDNNDDLDCLPEKAFLSDGRDIGVPGGSANVIVDQPCSEEQAQAGQCKNREFTTFIQGDNHDDTEGARCVIGTRATTALERDASRFSRALVVDEP